MSFKNFKFAVPVLLAGFNTACSRPPAVEIPIQEAYCERVDTGPTAFRIVTTNPKSPSEELYTVTATYDLKSDTYKGKALRNRIVDDGGSYFGQADFSASLDKKSCTLDSGWSSGERIYALTNG